MTNVTFLSVNADPQLLVYESDLVRLLQHAQSRLDEANADDNREMQDYWRAIQIGIQYVYRIHEANIKP